MFRKVMLWPMVALLWWPGKSFAETGSGAISDPAQLNLDPAILESSPTLQKWLGEPVNVLEDLRHDPSFATRIRVGYGQVSAGEDRGTLNLGVTDLFLGNTGITLDGCYGSDLGDRHRFHVDANYYVRPLGHYVNGGPTLGYHQVQTPTQDQDGLALGVKMIFALSRTGAADVTVSQRFVNPGKNTEMGITRINVGYAIAPSFRLSTEFENQNATWNRDRHVGLFLEYLP